MRRTAVAAVTLALTLLLGACAAPDATTAVLGSEKLLLYLADTDTEYATGLQRFDGLSSGEAMLFVYREAEPRTFVMRDVGFPIDVVFIGEDGRVDAVEPLDPGEVRQVSSPGACRYVLELPQGWAARHGIDVGATFEYEPGR